MARFLLNSCCGCFSLRTGTFIIAYFILFLTIVTIAAQAGVLAADDEPAWPGARPPDSSGAAALALLTALSALMLLGGLIFTVVLLMGLHQSRPALIYVFLVFAIVFLVLYFTSTVLSAFADFSVYKVISDTVYIALSVYFLLVVRSYYYQSTQPNEKRPPPAADELTAAE